MENFGRTAPLIKHIERKRSQEYTEETSRVSSEDESLAWHSPWRSSSSSPATSTANIAFPEAATAAATTATAAATTAAANAAAAAAAAAAASLQEHAACLKKEEGRQQQRQEEPQEELQEEPQEEPQEETHEERQSQCRNCGLPRTLSKGHAFYKGHFYCTHTAGPGAKSANEWLKEQEEKEAPKIPRTTAFTMRKKWENEHSFKPPENRRKPNKLRICQLCGLPKHKDYGHSQHQSEHFCAFYAGKSVELWLAERCKE
ncbi:AF4/FMR2 family member lilli-like [Betta splendens]|uniref:AF4/FMR2 family member lilli-like n=1 Tax=Betta splendens TaxID=158456 RepID=A0A9W2XK65_BETSP|nr:AF4/FMR2 family member lilli-like [Betta splendens]